MAHDVVLLAHGKRIVPGPIDDEPRREGRQHEGEDHRHPGEDFRLNRIGRLRVQPLLHPHGQAHDQGPGRHMQKAAPARGIEGQQAEQVEQIGRVRRG